MSRILVACEFSGTVRARPVAGYPGYMVTEDGRVFSAHTGRRLGTAYRELRAHREAKGYLSLTICARGKRKKVRVHRLIAEAFVENPLALPVVRHLDGDTSNNHAGNLAWGSYLDNENDKRRHGTWGLRLGGGKLTAEQRQEIFRRAASGQAKREIAASFGVSRPTVSRLLAGVTWKAAA